MPAHPANAQRLLRDEGRLALVFPEGQKGSRKLYWQRYRLRRFGRGGFVRTAMRAGVPIVPVAVVGAEEAMPIFAHVPLAPAAHRAHLLPREPRLSPVRAGAAGAMYLPAKFKIRFLEFSVAQDLDLWMRMSEVGVCWAIPKTFCASAI